MWTTVLILIFAMDVILMKSGVCQLFKLGVGNFKAHYFFHHYLQNIFNN